MVEKIKKQALVVFVFTFLWPLFIWGESDDQKINYQKIHLVDLKVEKCAVGFIFVDAHENYYVVQGKSPNVIIEIFDHEGKFVRKIDWINPRPKLSYWIKVDEEGNILLFGTDQRTGFILDKNGKTVGNFGVLEAFGVEFSNGNVYQKTNGKILYKLTSSKSGPKQKIYFKDFDEGWDVDKGRQEALKESQNHKYHYRPKNFGYLPEKIGGFICEGLLAVTDDGTSFAQYFKRNVPGYDFQNPKTETLKFDPKHQLMGVIPSEFNPPVVNLETNFAYQFSCSKEKNVVEVYRWEKIK